MRSAKQKEAQKHNWNKAVLTGMLTNLSKIIEQDERLSIASKNYLLKAENLISGALGYWKETR